MIPSISSEADEELREGALRYAREGNAELGRAFVEEFGDELRVIALAHHRRRPGYWVGRS